jgi:hypothetical protein
MAGPWEQFAPPPATAAPPPPADGPWSQFALAPAAQPAEHGEFGFAYAPEPAPAVARAAADAAPRSIVRQSSSPPLTGYLANIPAGLNSGIATTFGAPVDLLTGGINLGIRGANALAGLHVPAIDDPVGGSGTFKRAMGVVGANPDDVHADGLGQQLARSAASGAASALLPGGIVRGLGQAGVMAMPTVGRVLGVTGDFTAGNAGLGAVSGVGSQVAENAAPDEYKPLAGIVGGIVAPAVPLVGAAGVRAIARPVANAVSDYVGPAMKLNPLMDTAGSQFMTEGGRPIVANPATARMAGREIEGLATDPAAVRAALDNPPPPLVPGANPTAFHLTKDAGLGDAEQQISRTSADRPDFRIRQDARNDAQVMAARGIADEADPAAVQRSLQKYYADVDAAESARVAKAQQDAAAEFARTKGGLDAQRATVQEAADALVQKAGGTARAQADAMGGNLPSGSDAEVGAAARAPIAAGRQTAKQQEGALWEGIDPDGKLNVDMRPIKSAAQEIADGIGPNAAKLGGNEAEIFGTAAGLPDVQGFRDLQDLRQRLTAGIRAARLDQNADPQTVSRLSRLLSGVHDAMAGAVHEAPSIPDSPMTRAMVEADGGEHVPSTGSAVYTPDGQRVDVRYGVREAADLIASQLPDGRLNPAYPQELQPRDRTRAASTQQINHIANTLIPEKVGPSASTAEGAPLIGPDGIVESGNGRTLAIQQAHAQGGPQSQAYRDYLASHGFDVSNMKAPVLVRERTTPLADADRAAFADAAGASPVLGMSAPERAAADAKRLPSDALELYRGGDVTDARNRDFVRSFAQHVVPEGEHATFMTDDGALSTEGAIRVKNALTQHAYGSNDLVSALAETADPNIRAFGGAMADASGPMAKLRSAIDSGDVSSNNDMAKSLVEAANLVQTARRTRTPLSEVLAQHDAFAQRDPAVEPLLRAAYGDDYAGKMSRAKFADLLSFYVDEAQQQAGLFGANKGRTEILQEATQKYGYGAGRQERVASGTASGAGASAGPNRDQAFGSGDGAAGQANADAGSTSSPGDRNRAATPDVPAAPPLVANFDAAAAARYAAARRATLDRVRTYDKAPGVGKVLQGGPMSGEFRMAESLVPKTIVKVGPEGADVAKAYLKAGGKPEGLTELAAFSLRQAAVDEKTGLLDPGKYATWMNARKSFLSQIPDGAAKFGAAADASIAVKGAQQQSQMATKMADAAHGKALKEAAAKAQATINAAMAERADAVKAVQDSVAGKFLGNADPVAQVASILRSKTAVADMEHLGRLTENDPEARAGLQRAVANHILQDIKGDAKGAGSEESYFNNATLQKFLRKNDAALSKIMTPEQMTGLRNLKASLEESQLSSSGAKVGVGSDTAQNTSGSFLKLLAKKLPGTTGASLGAGVGYLVGGLPGGALGAKVGNEIGNVVQSMREAGLSNVEHLKAQALLNPALMRTLLAKATPANTPSLMANLSSQLRRASLVSAVRGAQPQRQDQPMPTRRNALLH